jgi:hypothetical protein
MAEREEREPPNDPMGVLEPDKIKTLSMLHKQILNPKIRLND